MTGSDIAVLVGAHSEAFATLLSVFSALLIGYAGFRQNQRRSRREYTQNIMLQRLCHDDLSRATAILADYAARGEEFRPDPSNPEELRLVRQLLSYYEFVAIAYLQKDLDRRTVRKQQRSALKSAYWTCKPYIEQHRKELKRNTLYTELETLAKCHL